MATQDASGFRRWAQGYRAEAASDDYRIVRDGWERGVVSCYDDRDPIQKWRARELVRDTIEVVALVLAYYGLDGRDEGERFLRLQTYDPVLSEGRYLLIFERGKYRRTQLIVDELRQVDLVDLHQVLCFTTLVVRRRDGCNFEAGEHQAVADAVCQDVRHDFSEEELPLDFNASRSGVHVEFLAFP